jgi:putative flippase GtrA
MQMATSEPSSTPRGLGSAVRSRLHLVRYALFAAAAIVVNLLSQNTALLVVGHMPFGIYLAIACGTGAGLLFKYICDKYWVFEDGELSVSKDSRKFLLYAAFGIFPTLIFWGTELVFHYMFVTRFMTNLGGFIGLCVGYTIKYNLDKLVTFRNAKGGAKA